VGRGDIEGIAKGFVDDVEGGTTYVLGPGSTVGAIKEELGFEGTPLGVDVWRLSSGVVAEDANEDDILENLGERNVVVVSPIGDKGLYSGVGTSRYRRRSYPARKWLW
ncbi:MAG: hypothetical protein SV377_01285, partial [Halobacteria archaeon]|nr:hypothetical protein [Halobacteria archaeon]